MKKLTRSQKQYLLVTLISIGVIGIGFIAAYTLTVRQLETKYKSKIVHLESEITENKKRVYTAKEEIKAGELIEKGKLEETQIYTSQPEAAFINQEDFGKLAAVDIRKSQPVLSNMLTPDLELGLREQEFSLFKLNTNLEKNDFVDIRIRFPNGEDYIVLSKKALKDINLEENDCFLWLDEEEILNISAAIVDAYLHAETDIYTAKYIESGQQESVPTYQPNESVMLLIANNPNIIEEARKELDLRARKELEERLNVFEEKESKSEGEGNGLETAGDENSSLEDDTVYSVDESEVDYVD